MGWRRSLKAVDEALLPGSGAKCPTSPSRDNMIQDNALWTKWPACDFSKSAPDIARVHRHEFSGSWQPFGVFRGIGVECVRLGCLPDSQTELYRVDSNGKLGSGDLYALPNSYSVTGIYFNTKLAES